MQALHGTNHRVSSISPPFAAAGSSRSHSSHPDSYGKAIELRDLSQVYPGSAGRSSVTALEHVDLRIEPGEFVSLVGPTGCGKSTALSAISGLRLPSSGSVTVGNDAVTAVRHDVGLVFQQDALLPWRSALHNVALPLRFRGVRRKEALDRARGWLHRVGLEGFEDSYPHQLSGGMRKRVAIAATLVYEPQVLLMDEPFSALDVQTRTLMENDLLSVVAGRQTVVFVTHDLEEAIGLSDRIVVLTARPGTVYGDYTVDLPRPRNLLDIKLLDDFGRLYRKIWADLEMQVLKGAGVSKPATR